MCGRDAYRESVGVPGSGHNESHILLIVVENIRVEHLVEITGSATDSTNTTGTTGTSATDSATDSTTDSTIKAFNSEDDLFITLLSKSKIFPLWLSFLYKAHHIVGIRWNDYDEGKEHEYDHSELIRVLDSIGIKISWLLDRQLQATLRVAMGANEEVAMEVTIADDVENVENGAFGGNVNDVMDTITSTEPEPASGPTMNTNNTNSVNIATNTNNANNTNSVNIAKRVCVVCTFTNTDKDKIYCEVCR